MIFTWPECMSGIHSTWLLLLLCLLAEMDVVHACMYIEVLSGLLIILITFSLYCECRLEAVWKQFGSRLDADLKKKVSIYIFKNTSDHQSRQDADWSTRRLGVVNKADRVDCRLPQMSAETTVYICGQTIINKWDTRYICFYNYIPKLYIQCSVKKQQSFPFIRHFFLFLFPLTYWSYVAS